MRRTLFPAICLSASTLALAQARPLQAQQVADDADRQQPIQQAQPTPAGRVASSSAGQAGQRQTREQTVESAAPVERIASRIPNRVQSRLRNRIDRNYDPQANAISPFTAAEDQARDAGRANR